MGKKYTGKEEEPATSITNNGKVIDVYFDTFQKRYFFLENPNFDVKINEKVLVETQMGLAIGKVIAVKSDYKYDEKEPLKRIIRKATDKDLEKNKELKEDAVKAGFIFRNKIKKYNLNLKLVATEYTFDRKKLIFYFASEERVDFRSLVKDLAAIFKVRIELRQIGVRDFAKMVGDCGSCGKTLCCKSFINKFDSVSIKMARDQGLVINPTKISGVCGRLLCCINYEYSQYEEALKNFPAVNQSVKTEIGEGKVVSISPLNNFLYVDVKDKGISRFSIDDIKFNRKEASILKNMKTKEEIENKILEKE